MSWKAHYFIIIVIVIVIVIVIIIIFIVTITVNSTITITFSSFQMLNSLPDVLVLAFRNSEQVAMAAFAPLFSHWNDRVWPHNLIIFDNHR